MEKRKAERPNRRSEYLNKEKTISFLRDLAEPCSAVGNVDAAIALHFAANRLSEQNEKNVTQVQRSRWVDVVEFEDGQIYAKCDNCKKSRAFFCGTKLSKYCPSCGALMSKNPRKKDDHH